MRHSGSWIGRQRIAGHFGIGLCVGLWLTSARAWEAQDNAGLGCLSAPSLSPGHILRANPLFLVPRCAQRGTREVIFDAHWANIWNYDSKHYLIDGEWIRGDVRFQYAVDDRLSAGVYVPIMGRTGGFADETIEGFHTALHLGNSHREVFPRNRSVVQVTNGGGTRRLAEGDSWGVGDVAGFVGWQVTDGNAVWPQVMLQGQVTAPTGESDELRGLGEASAAAGMVFSKRLWDSAFILFAGAGIFYCGADEFLGIELNHEEHSGLVGLEYQYSSSLSLVLQSLSSSPVARDYHAFSKGSHEVSVGFKWRRQDHTLVELSVVENVAVFKNSADIGIHLALGRRF
jgi:hypothetical protein